MPQFSAAPKIVQSKPKYKATATVEQPTEDDEIKLIYNNLMWDKRIVRGNTYAAIVTAKGMEMSMVQQWMVSVGKLDHTNSRAPIQIWTDQFVESLTDKPPKYQYGAQTQPIKVKDVERFKMKEKVGMDVETQIWDNQLFDFDYEVQPLLRVLCGRTLQISRLQVLQEQQLRVMSNRQQELHLKEAAQKQKIRRMYDKEEKLEQENKGRLQGYVEDRNGKIEMHKKLFGRVVAKQYLKEIKNKTITTLDHGGYFRNQLDEALLNQASIGLCQMVLGDQGVYQAQNAQLKVAVQTAIEQLLKAHRQTMQVQAKRRGLIFADRHERERERLERKQMKAQELRMRMWMVEDKARKLEEERINKEMEEAAEAEAKENKEA